MAENKIKHLEFIQSTIIRMANNSFLLKGWTISIIIGVFALSKESFINSFNIFITILPIIVFWVLDGYFLFQERLYRSLYSKVSKTEEVDIDFSMNAYIFVDDIKNNKLSSMFSETLNIFYISLLVITLFLICFNV